MPMHVQIIHIWVVKKAELENMSFLILLAVFIFGTEGMNVTLPEWKDLECEVCFLLTSYIHMSKLIDIVF